MAPSPAQDDELESLLRDEEPAKPEPEEPAPVEPKAEAPAPEAPPSESKPPEPKPAAQPAARPAARERDSGWMVWALIVLLLLATIIGVAWYANEQRMQVKDLKDQLETAKTQATSMETAAGTVADDLLPLVEEQLAIAKIREAAGDGEGAKYARLLAQRYAEMAEKLAGQTPPSKLRDLKAQIEGTATAVQSSESTAPSSEATAGTSEAAPAAEQPAPTTTAPAPEAGTGTAPAPAAPEAQTPTPAVPQSGTPAPEGAATGG